MTASTSRWRSSITAGDHLHPDRPHPRCHRRIYTDGRDWPEGGRARLCGLFDRQMGRLPTATASYDMLEVETRHFKGPRAYDATGLPLHADNQTVVKERIYLDKADPNTPAQRDHRHRQCADAAVDGDQELQPRTEPHPFWREYLCRRTTITSPSARRAISSAPTAILMPAKKDQPPPDLRYFEPQRRSDRSREL